jgi:predicted nucleic acid-binding protein
VPIHLDSNFLAAAIAQGSRERATLKRWMSAGETLHVSSMAWAEFVGGPLPEGALPDIEALVGTSLPSTSEDALHAARLFNATGRRPRSLADCIIAAVAIRSTAESATNDVAHCSRFAEFGLRLAE